MVHMFSHSIFDFAFGLSHILHVAYFSFYAIDQVRTVTVTRYVVFYGMGLIFFSIL